jgi:hypothetical protein
VAQQAVKQTLTAAPHIVITDSYPLSFIRILQDGGDKSGYVAVLAGSELQEGKNPS